MFATLACLSGVVPKARQGQFVHRVTELMIMSEAGAWDKVKFRPLEVVCEAFKFDILLTLSIAAVPACPSEQLFESKSIGTAMQRSCFEHGDNCERVSAH